MQCHYGIIVLLQMDALGYVLLGRQNGHLAGRYLIWNGTGTLTHIVYNWP